MKTRNVAKDFPVVCVGGSAGGLDAYIHLLRHLPADMGVAIVIVNHLRTVATILHEILPHHTEMPVELITERFNVIDLTNWFVTWVKAPFLDGMFSWIFSAWPDGFDGGDEQTVQFA